MKFGDLEFKPHPSFEIIKAIPKCGEHYQAVMDFDNGYGVSVVYGDFFFGRGYELAVMKGGEICYDTHITNDVLKHLTRAEITKTIKQVEILSGDLCSKEIQ